MRARALVAPAAAALLLLAACGDGATNASTGKAAPTDDLTNAVEVAQLTMPVALPDGEVGDLIDGLCDAGTSGDPAAFTASLQALPLDDQGQRLVALDALSIGAGDYCPAAAAPVVPAIEAAIAPAAITSTTAPAPAVSASSGSGGGSGTSGTGSGSSGSGSSGSGSSSSGSGSGGSTNESSGSAEVGGGNASGSGNQSGTDFTQSVGSSGSSNGTP